MDIEKNLELLGLTSTEAKIYLTLLRIGESTAVSIAKETDIHRRTIYDNINILLKKGLVSYKIKDGVKYFNANNPLTFKGFLDEKSNAFETILPTLNSFYENKQISPKIDIYSGVQGAKSIIEEAIKKKHTLYWVGGGLYFFESLGFSKEFIEQKMSKANIMMVQADTKNIKEKLGSFKKENVRLLPNEYSSFVGYLIYGETVAIGLIQGKNMIMIRVNSKEFSHGYKKYFDIMWNAGRKL
jgi:sugar-specific transcriptional regulator TrmB